MAQLKSKIMKQVGAMTEASRMYRSGMSRRNWELARLLHSLRQEAGAREANRLIQEIAEDALKEDAMSPSKLEKLLLVGQFTEDDLKNLGLEGITTDDFVDVKSLLLQKKSKIDKRSDSVGQRAWELLLKGTAIQSIRDRLKTEGFDP